MWKIWNLQRLCLGAVVYFFLSAGLSLLVRYIIDLQVLTMSYTPVSQANKFNFCWEKFESWDYLDQIDLLN